VCGETSVSAGLSVSVIDLFMMFRGNPVDSELSVRGEICRFPIGIKMTDLYFNLGSFGSSARYQVLFGEMTLPFTVISVDAKSVTVCDDARDATFIIDEAELVTPDPEVGDRLDCVVLVEPNSAMPGIASERRACRVGVNVESFLAEVTAIDGRTVSVIAGSENYTMLISHRQTSPVIGHHVWIERHNSGVMWLR